MSVKENRILREDDIYVVDDADFEYYQECVHYWLGHFGISDWEIFFKRDTDDDDARGAASFDHTNKIAIFYLAEDWGELAPTKKYLSRVAFHEVLEVFLSWLRCHAMDGIPRALEHFVDGQVHSVIRTFENIYFDRYTDKNGKLIKL